ncbi:hypothetical protein IQ266_17885 [filamentous cyanobacterium LEGE 11480]|uniref:Uncharacterized protein n=1 Tax=Romeriopsis navalis LEGE 11480 TaxID=2777977 RepID=A0A928Z524_9CYAN|nr:hypothetical protein [Romeriopsis navalis]MBE9031607.1 hypothetical protein [Romeriopsis navalis LEGE 11480]
MTTLDRNLIPSGITTVEQLSVWAASVIRANAGNTSVVEVRGGDPIYVAQIPVIEDANNIVRIIPRISMALDPIYDAATTGKLWTFAEEITTGTIPLAYTTD